MRVFILPSWCPTPDKPLQGSFFVEQADALARVRPHWNLAICLFDLARSRLPWRPQSLPQFIRDWLTTPPVAMSTSSHGLHIYRAWAVHLPAVWVRDQQEAGVAALTRHAALALADFTRRFGKPDLIHAHAATPGGTAAVRLGCRHGIPVGITEHMGPMPWPAHQTENGSPNQLIKETYANVTRSSAVSRALADRLRDLGLANEVAVIPNFLDDEGITSSCGQRQPGAPFAFLSVGAPGHGKGTDLLLKAFARFHSPAVLAIVGDSPERPAMMQLACELGIAGRVEWLGNVPRAEMPGHYERCDAFVLPSRAETFGVTYIEALACGKPLIATYCGGPEDIVTQENGLLVPVDNIDSLGMAMATMAANYRAYSPDALRADFLARFSASVIANQLEEWYSLVAAAGR